MIRASFDFFERFSPFFLPFLIYFGYLAGTRVWPPGSWREHPWVPLTVVGLVLAVISFFVWHDIDAEPITGTYVAPHVVNGKIVPGYVAPPEKKP